MPILRRERNGGTVVNDKRAPFDWRLHAALLWVQFTFGAAAVFAKYVLGYLSPLAVGGCRVLGATPLLLALAWAFERTLPRKRDLLPLLGLGFLGIFCNQLLFLFGLKFTTATNGAILQLGTPVFTAAIAFVVGVERIGFWQGCGIGLSIAGALTMIGPARLTFGGEQAFGNLLILLNSLCYSGYLVSQRPLLRRLGPLTVVAWSFLFGGLGVAAVAAPATLAIDVRATPGLVWVGVAYIVFLQTAANYALNTWAMRRSTPSLVASYNTLQPLSAAVLAAVFLGETVGWREGLGFALILGGLMLVARRRPAVAEAAGKAVTENG